MAESQERRLHPRKEFINDVYCYTRGGIRLNLKTENISRSGVFIKTDESIPMYSKVVTTFIIDLSCINPIYLSGLVVRIQTEPEAGVGIAWEKALTQNPRESLRRFLETVLEISDPTIEFRQIAGLEETDKSRIGKIFSEHGFTPVWGG